MYKYFANFNSRIEKTIPPKLRVASRLEDVREKYQSTKHEFEDVRKRAKMAKIEFEQLKQKRRNLFMECFNFVSEKIDDTYKGTFIEHLTAKKAFSFISF